jgi:hypothetical protein
MFWERLENMLAVSDRFIQVIAVDHRFNFAVISP